MIEKGTTIKKRLSMGITKLLMHYCPILLLIIQIWAGFTYMNMQTFKVGLAKAELRTLHYTNQEGYASWVRNTEHICSTVANPNVNIKPVVWVVNECASADCSPWLRRLWPGSPGAGQPLFWPAGEPAGGSTCTFLGSTDPWCSPCIQWRCCRWCRS